MKITHICLCGTITDGWNYQDNLLSKYHRVLGNEVSVIASRWVRDDKGGIYLSDKTRYVNSDGVTMYRIANKSGNIDSKFKRYAGLYEALETTAPDIIFIHNVQFLDITQIVKYAKKHRVTIYADNHSDFSNSATNFFSRNILHKIVWRHCAKKIEPYTKKFYGVLPARVDFLKDVYKLPEEKCELLVMGADDELVEKAKDAEVRHKIREKYGISDDDFLIMTGGKIDSFKTQTLLLMQAVKELDNPRVKLVVFGSVSKELSERVKELADGKKVQYIGWIQSRDSYEYFAASDLVVFPGRHSVFWEQAAAQGIPEICKKWDGTTHVDLGGNVIFLEKDSAEEIKEKIQDLISNPEKYNAMKKVAEEKGAKYFSYLDIARRSIEE